MDIIKKGKQELGKNVRNDGFTVFYDGDKQLDKIRRYGTKKQVIIAVALRRCQQIAMNYAMKYAPELLEEFKKQNLLKEVEENEK